MGELKDAGMSDADLTELGFDPLKDLAADLKQAEAFFQAEMTVQDCVDAGLSLTSAKVSGCFVGIFTF